MDAPLSPTLPPPPSLYDISPPLGPATPLYPGDEPFALRWLARIGPGSPINLGALTVSPHSGAHADAPLHYAAGAPAIDQVDLSAYLGPCRVLHTIGVGPLVTVAALRAAGAATADLPPRVLLRTCERASTVWDPNFTAIDPAALSWLAERGVRLVGIDTPSVDPADSTALDAHQALHRHDLRVLENLVLDAVPAGDYELIALPLKLVGACASPVRAVLRRP